MKSVKTTIYEKANSEAHDFIYNTETSHDEEVINKVEKIRTLSFWRIESRIKIGLESTK